MNRCMYTEHSYEVKNPQNVKLLKINNKYKKIRKIKKIFKFLMEKDGAHI